MQPRPTIETVATRARVSVKTVSRVINNAACVTPATRDHVMNVIRQLSFSPSPMARRLAGHRSYLVGLPFDSGAARYVTEVQMGSLPTCRAENYQVVMHACDSSAPDVAEQIQLFVQRVRVDGVILTPPLSSNPAVQAALEAQSVPYVTITSSRGADSARSVFTNDREVSAAMTRYLVSCGHARVAFLGGGGELSANMERYQGYCDGLAACGLPFDAALVSEGEGSVTSGVECARALLRRRNQRPTAIFASSDAMAAGALVAAHELGVPVPERLSVAGFEDDPIATQVWPRLTTIRLPIQAMAEQAAGLLMRQLRGRTRAHPLRWARAEDASVGSSLIESALIIRQSTGRAPGSRAA